MKPSFKQLLKNTLSCQGNFLKGKIGDENWKYRGLAFAELGEYKEALNAFDNAMKTEHKDLLSLDLQRNCSHVLKRYEEALKTFEGAEEAIYAA